MNLDELTAHSFPERARQRLEELLRMAMSEMERRDQQIEIRSTLACILGTEIEEGHDALVALIDKCPSFIPDYKTLVDDARNWVLRQQRFWTDRTAGSPPSRDGESREGCFAMEHLGR